MPLTFTFDSIGTGVRADLGATDGETLFVGQEATLLSTDGSSAVTGTGDNQTLNIRGELYSSNQTAIDLSGDHAVVDIADTGSVTNAGLDLSDRALRISAENTVLHNAGTISGHVGAYLFGQSTSLVNTGTISSFASELVGSTMYAVRTLDTGAEDASLINTIENHGTLSSNFEAIDANDDFDNDGTPNFSRMTTHVLNTGDVYGNVRLGGFDDQLINSGLIAGLVDMGYDEDRFENSGTLIGDALLGNGNDVYRGDGDSTVSGEIFGGLGEDRMFGGQNSDIMFGESDADKMRGRQGNDELFGGEGDDNIKGNDGDDYIEGNQDNDILRGGRGDDEIKGGSGNDTITGGTGEDILTGNSGADIFVFTRRSGDDEITDFANNTDRLDLSFFGLTARQDLTDAGAIVENGSGSIIDLTQIGGDGVIYVDDMTVNQWGNSDFIF